MRSTTSAALLAAEFLEFTKSGMLSSAGTFSESWYRIADQHAALRPHVQVRRQFYRGECWYVLQDPMNNQFFRLRPAAYDFVARLRLHRSIEQARNECVAAHPDQAQAFVSAEDELIGRFLPGPARSRLEAAARLGHPGVQRFATLSFKYSQFVAQRQAFRERSQVLKLDTWLAESPNFAGSAHTFSRASK